MAEQENEREFWEYHNPKNELFVRDGHSDPWAVRLVDFDLVTSFINSRPRNDGIHLSSFDRNAGAVALYNKVDGSKIINLAVISEPIYDEYGEYTCYGHTERRLMRKVLNELAKLPNHHNFKGPSSLNEEQDEFQILKNLADPKIAEKYRSDFDTNEIIVKMWSERPPCVSCEKFLRNICPEGSEIRYIVEKHRPTGEEVQAAFEALENAYQQFLASEQDKPRRLNQCFI